MAWVSVHDGVTDHPKTRKLARELKCGRHEAIGILVSLWQWGLHNADRDGVIQNATEDDIADGIMYRPSSGLSDGQASGQSSNTARTFLNALIEAGWVDREKNGAYRLHDWDEWQSEWFKYLDKLETDRRRKREAREKERSGDGMPCEKSTGTSSGLSDGQASGIPPVTITKPNHNQNHNKNGNETEGNNPPTPRKRGSRQTQEPKSPKTQYAEFVSMTNDEYESLVAKLGESGTQRCVEILDNYKGANGKKYASDYRAILNWVIKRYEEEQLRPQPPNSKTSHGGKPDTMDVLSRIIADAEGGDQL